MSIDQHVNVTLTVNNFGIALEGFGTIAVLTYKTFFPGTSVTYRRLADAIAAGLPADSPEALAIAKILSQSPHPLTVKLIKGTRPPTQRYTIAVSAVKNLFPYKVNVKGEGVTATAVEYVSDANATNDEIVAGLVAALNLVVGKNFTAVAIGGAGAQQCQVTADAAADWFSLEVLDTTALKITQDHADPGIAADLTDILVQDKDWYYLATCFNSSAMVLAAMAWVEATAFKAYPVQVHDSDCENTVVAGATDVIAQWALLSYKRSFPFYHRKPDQMLGAGFAGRVCALPVGSWSGAYKSIAGATYDAFTAQQTTNLDNKKGSYYKLEAGFSITWETKVSNASYGFFDVTVALDFVLDLIQKRAFAVKVALNKVAYTDDDIQGVMLPAVEGAIDICKSDKHKIVAPGTPGDENDPQPSVTFPKVKDIDPGSRALRELPDGSVSFRMQGAVHKTFVDVNVSF